jgi:hypothetical protein
MHCFLHLQLAEKPHTEVRLQQHYVTLELMEGPGCNEGVTALLDYTQLVTLRNQINAAIEEVNQRAREAQAALLETIQLADDEADASPTLIPEDWPMSTSGNEEVEAS